MTALRARPQPSAPSATRLGRWTSFLALALVGVASLSLCLLATATSAEAAPLETVAARDRDEDVRFERFLPPLAALAGGLGFVWASRRGDKLRARRIAAASAILATLLALGPLYMLAPRPLNRQPSPDAQEYADATRHLAAGEGYVTTIYNNQPRPPRYPPGFSLALTPFALAGTYPANVQLGSKVYAMLYIVATLVAAWMVAGPLAAAIAVALVGSSPFALRFSSLVMSDAFAAGLVVVTLALVHRPTPRRLVAAGLLSGGSLLVRLGGILTVEALLPSVNWRGRALVVAASMVGVVALGAHQWSTFGDPFMTGYQYWLPEIRSFGFDYPFDAHSQRDGSGVVADSLDGALLAWACPCPEDDPLMAFPSIVFYPLVLLGMYWIFTPPLATIPGLIEVWRRQREAGPGFAFWLTLLTVLFYLVYFYMGARFMAGPATLLAIYSGVAMARWTERLAGIPLTAGAPPDASEAMLAGPVAGAALSTPGPCSAPKAPATPTIQSEIREAIQRAVARLTRTDLVILAALTVLAALPRLANILGLDPFVDEASWTDWAVHQFNPLVPRSWFAPLLTDGRPPLHFWLTLPIAAVVDNGFVAGRMAAALAGILSTLVLYGLGCELTGSRTTAAVAAALWAVSPFSVFFARVAVDDALLALTAMLVTWASIRLARKPSRANGVFCGLALGLGVLAKTTGVIFGIVPLLAILVLGHPRAWRSYLQPFLLIVAIGFACTIPLLIWFQPVFAQILMKTPTSSTAISGSALLAQNTEVSIGWLRQFMGLGLPALAALGLVLAVVARQRPLLLVALLGVLWLVAILYLTAPLFSRYLLFALFPAYLLAGYAVERVASWLGIAMRRLSAARTLKSQQPSPTHSSLPADAASLAPAVSLAPVAKCPAVWGEVAIRVAVVVTGLTLALAPRAGLLRDIIFDPVHAQIPESEHFRYVEQWYALHGLGQIADELHRRGQDKVVTVLVPPASREDRVLVPHSALRSYLRGDETVQFVEVPALFRAQDLREVRRLAQNRPTFLLVNGTYLDQPGTSSDAPTYTRRIEERLARDVPTAKEVLRIPRPDAPNWLSLYRLDRGD